MMKLKVVYLLLKTEKAVKEDASKLRGFISNRFKEHPILHHHVEGGYIYTYPKVQYKIVGGTPLILGIEEGASVLHEISEDIHELKLGRCRYKVESIQVNKMYVEIGCCKEKRRYKFLTPWLALNQENYRKYKEIKDWKRRKAFVDNILIGNILSMCKGLNHIVTGRLHAHSLLSIEKTVFKGIPMMGFVGEFVVNFKIPDFFGLGKGVSQGFGVVRACETSGL